MKNSLLSFVLVAVFLLSGCGLKPAEIVQTGETAQSEQTDNPHDNDAYHKFRLYNATGFDIYAVSFREATSSADYEENLLAPGFVLHNGSWMDVSYDSSKAEKDFELLDKKTDGAELTCEYRMLFVLNNGRYYELSAFPLDDMEDCTVLLSDNVGYLCYNSLCTDQLVNTKEAELAIYEKLGRQARDISNLVSELPLEPLPTAPVESPLPTAIPEVDEKDEERDPNEGCLIGGLFY